MGLVRRRLVGWSVYLQGKQILAVRLTVADYDIGRAKVVINLFEGPLNTFQATGVDTDRVEIVACWSVDLWMPRTNNYHESLVS